MMSESEPTTPLITKTKNHPDDDETATKTKTTTSHHHHHHPTGILTLVIHMIDSIVELYLIHIIKPFLELHEIFYNTLNYYLRYHILEKYTNSIPMWFTANFITYGRTLLFIPTLYFMSYHYTIIPSFIVLFVDFCDFLDGVVARYWVEKKNKKKKETTKEVTTTGSHDVIQSWNQAHRNTTYGGFIDAVCDKVYVIPCWISLLYTIPKTIYMNHMIQYFILFCLIVAEMTGGFVRFRAYYTSVGVPTPTIHKDCTIDFTTSAVKADHLGKAKQTFEMVGTALYIITYTKYIGFLLLSAAVPLAYESVKRKIIQRNIYVVHHGISSSSSLTSLDHRILKFWMQASTLGSKLIVGLPSMNDEITVKESDDIVLNACAVHCVDEVLMNVPKQIDLLFLEKYNISFVIITATTSGQQQQSFITEEVMNANRVLSIGDDNIVRMVTGKVAGKKE